MCSAENQFHFFPHKSIHFRIASICCDMSDLKCEIGIIIILPLLVLDLRPEKDALLQLYFGNNVLLLLELR